MDLEELRQLVAFDELGTFAKVARKFYVSTPTVARAMQRVEQEFGVPLFDRGKNKVELSEAGRLAAKGARRVLAEIDASISEVQAYDRSLRTVEVVSCAPAPLWVLTPRIGRLYPGMGLATRVADLEEVERDLAAGGCDVAVLPYRPDEGAGLTSVHLMDERLFVCVPRDHALACRESVTLDEINGFNFLLGTDLGFWNQIVRRRLTASRFLVQEDEFALEELINSSSLPCFTTDVAIRYHYRGVVDDRRVMVPIDDPEVNVRFWLAAQSDRAQKVARLF